MKNRLKALHIVAYGIAIGKERRNETYAASPHNSNAASRQYSISVLFIGAMLLFCYASMHAYAASPSQNEPFCSTHSD